MTKARPDDPPTVLAQISGVTIHVVCPCGADTLHVIDCVEDRFGGWSADMEERFILCDSCDQLVDAGFQVELQAPE